ncbi:MAG: sigma-70 family RNA polymerase sigma factor [Propionibacteriaceae bacterium]|nr:sigma-70 family RNA polymerase sigma factor [Propionibacteriaceae bacterium]
MTFATEDRVDPCHRRQVPRSVACGGELMTEQEFEDEIVPMLAGLVRYFARRVTPSDAAADCASETTLIMWRERHRLPVDPDDRRAWAYTIARNVLQNHARKRVRRRALDRGLRHSLTAVSDPATSAGERVLHALEGLPEADRELIRLVIWDGFGVAEAGQVLGLRPDAARKRYQRAKERLRVEYAGLVRRGE